LTRLGRASEFGAKLKGLFGVSERAQLSCSCLLVTVFFLDGIPNATKYLIACLKLNLEVENIHESKSTLQVVFSNSFAIFFVFPFIHPACY